MADPLFDVRNNFYLGAYQQCINEAQNTKCKTDEEKLQKNAFLYRAYIALNKHSIPLSEIKSSDSSAPLLSVRRFAEYMSNTEARPKIIRELTNELEKGGGAEDEYSLLTNATIFLQEENVEDALRVLSRTSEASLECSAMKVQCLLKLCRIDLAAKELKKMHELDEDATITQLATAWTNMAMGKDKIKDAFYIYQEMIDKYGATPSLLVSQASCLIQQQKYEDAEKLLLDAQQRDPNNAEALIALFVVTQFLGKPFEVSNRYMNQLKQDHPTHAWTKDLLAKEVEFDRLA